MDKKPRREPRPPRSRCSRAGPLPRASVAALLAALAAAPACGGGEGGGQTTQVGTTTVTTPAGAAAATEQQIAQATGEAQPTPAAPTGPKPGAAAGEGRLQHTEMTADLFNDNPEHRDPFTPFQSPKSEAPAETLPQALPIVPLPAAASIAFPDTELDDLQCRMVLAMGGEKPRAYLLGPDGEHAFVTQGQYVGRAIRGAETEAEVHWRVYEIEEGGVSFELSNVSSQEGDTGARPALRLYSTDEMKKFEDLFSLR